MQWDNSLVAVGMMPGTYAAVSASESISLFSFIMKTKKKGVWGGVLSKGVLRWNSLILTELLPQTQKFSTHPHPLQSSWVGLAWGLQPHDSGSCLTSGHRGMIVNCGLWWALAPTFLTFLRERQSAAQDRTLPPEMTQTVSRAGLK